MIDKLKEEVLRKILPTRTEMTTNLRFNTLGLLNVGPKPLLDFLSGRHLICFPGKGVASEESLSGSIEVPVHRYFRGGVIIRRRKRQRSSSNLPLLSIHTHL